jgi:hypothetical protein
MAQKGREKISQNTAPERWAKTLTLSQIYPDPAFAPRFFTVSAVAA